MSLEKYEKVLHDKLTKPIEGAFVSSVSASDKGFESLNLWLGKLKTLQSKIPKAEKSLSEELTKPTEDAIAPSELKTAAGEEWPEIENDDATLEALAWAIQIRRIREQGEIPPHYTAVTVCAHCGPVPIFAGVAERVEGCPWCFNRITGHPIPGGLKPT